MRGGLTITAVSAAALVGQAAAQATPSTENPAGVVYKATLPEDGSVTGSISAVAGENGEGVAFTIEFAGLAEGGPFSYHLHVDPVPEDGNCTKTLAHLDPFGAGTEVPCNPDTPEQCEVGDLSGKYGKISTESFSAQYTDPYASTQEGDVSFFGDRSFVIHYANSSRLACANFVQEGAAPPPPGNSTTGVPGPTGTGGVPGPTTTDGPPVSGAAQLGSWSLPLLMAGGAMLAFHW